MMNCSIGKGELDETSQKSRMEVDREMTVDHLEHSPRVADANHKRNERNRRMVLEADGRRVGAVARHSGLEV